MTGVVLCGGTSTRMGTDKGLLKEEAVTWAELAAQKLTAVGLPVVVSVNQQQFPAYAQIFAEAQLVVDDAASRAKGPLLGLLSVHQKLQGEDLFVLACDLKDITTSLLHQLLAKAPTGNPDALVYSTQEKPQPLCGIYSANGLEKIEQLLQEGKLARFSMMHVLETLDTRLLPAGDDELPAFANYNSPDEIG